MVAPGVLTRCLDYGCCWELIGTLCLYLNSICQDELTTLKKGNVVVSMRVSFHSCVESAKTQKCWIRMASCGNACFWPWLETGVSLTAQLYCILHVHLQEPSGFQLFYQKTDIWLVWPSLQLHQPPPPKKKQQKPTIHLSPPSQCCFESRAKEKSETHHSRSESPSYHVSLGNGQRWRPRSWGKGQPTPGSGDGPLPRGCIPREVMGTYWTLLVYNW